MDGSYLMADSICVEFPSFISPESTPNLRLLTTDQMKPYVTSWLEDLRVQHPEFAEQVKYVQGGVSGYWDPWRRMKEWAEEGRRLDSGKHKLWA